MKYNFKTTLFVISVLAGSIASYAQEDHERECTHGTLIISDLDTASLRLYDLDGGLMNLKARTTLQVPGNPGQVLAVTGSGTNVASMFRGTQSLFYADGRVNFIKTGVSKKDHGDHFDVEKGTPSILDNAGFECARPIHVVNHDNKVAIFCDGSYDATPEQINSTVWVLDETLMGEGSSSAIIFTSTLQGSHHGVAIPVDDNHVLYSLAAPERVNRVPNGTEYALPETFQVVDYDGIVLHSLVETSNPSKSCSGFHGSSAIDNTFALACDEEHGGILVVDYEPTSAAYTSRALSYPLDNHRTGTFAEHPKSPYVVGNFAGENNVFHLLAFDPAQTVAPDNSHIQTLEARQCSFDFEKASGKLLLVWLMSGKLQVYKVDPEWALVAEIQVIQDMVSCTEASMVAGYGHTFVVAPTTQTLYALNLEHAEEEGNIEMYDFDLGFTPNSAVVAGVPGGAACLGEDHDHDTSEATYSTFSTLLSSVMVGLVMLHTVG